MSNPVTNSDIEDVLSSIRRLVSEDTRTRKPQREAPAQDRLVLTPALRVQDPSEPEKPAELPEIPMPLGPSRAAALPEAPMPLRAAATPDPILLTNPTDRAPKSQDRPGEPVAPESGAEDAVDGEDEAREPSLAALSRLVEEEVERALSASSDAQDDWSEEAWAEEEDTRADNAEAEAPASETHDIVEWSEARIAEPRGSSEQSVPIDLDAVRDAFAEAEAEAAEEVDALDAPATEADAVALEHKIAAIEALLRRQSGQDAVPEDAEDRIADALDDDVPENWPEAEPEAVLPDPEDDRPEFEVNDPAAVTPPAAFDEAPDLDALASFERDDLVEEIEEADSNSPATFIRASANDALDWEDIEPLQENAPAAALLEAPEEDTAPATLDEEMLRSMVSALIREELQGVLGERITRNVRKLVRREIHRVLMTQDYD